MILNSKGENINKNDKLESMARTITMMNNIMVKAMATINDLSARVERLEEENNNDNSTT